MTDAPQIPEEVVETVRAVLVNHGHGSCCNDSSDRHRWDAISTSRAALKAVAPALMALGAADAEVEANRRVAACNQQWLTDWKERDDAARAEGAAEVSAAVEEVAALFDTWGWCETHGAREIAPRVRAAISPEGIEAHNAKIAAEAWDEGSVEADSSGAQRDNPYRAAIIRGDV